MDEKKINKSECGNIKKCLVRVLKPNRDYNPVRYGQILRGDRIVTLFDHIVYASNSAWYRPEVLDYLFENDESSKYHNAVAEVSVKSFNTNETEKSYTVKIDLLGASLAKLCFISKKRSMITPERVISINGEPFDLVGFKENIKKDKSARLKKVSLLYEDIEKYARYGR